MDIDELSGLAETLRKRIEEHRQSLQQNETRTRYALVDPLLRVLGWDLEDPGQVVPEYTVGQAKRADYALLAAADAQSPSLFIEVKALGRALSDGIDQSINYCIQEDVKYFGVTDGARWEIYDIYKPGKLPDKRIVEFGVSDSGNQFALHALWLWRGNHATHAPVASPLPPESTHTGAPAAEPAHTKLPTTTAPLTPAQIPTQTVLSGTAPPGAVSAWRPLSQLQPSFHDIPPNTIRFPDKTEIDIKSWTDLALSVVKWLVDNGTLTPAQCPIRRAARHLVNATPVHPNGNAFTQDKQVGPVHMEANYSGRDLVRNARLILKHVGQDAAQFFVRAQK